MDLPDAGAPVTLDPRALLDPRRLDLIVKVDFFREWLAGAEGPALDLYLRHISCRTGGFEGHKRSPDDYVREARALIDSVRRTGFDAARPAVISRVNGLPLDGAHRVAACLALGLPVTVVSDDERPGGVWDIDWFRAHGFAAPDLNRLLRGFAAEGERVVVFAFWGPSHRHWSEMLDALASSMALVGHADLTLHPDDIPVILDDIYAWGRGTWTLPRIREKAEGLVASGPPVIRAVLACAPGNGPLADAATEAKRTLRRLAGRDADDFWSTVHASDSAAEARYLSDVLFNENYTRLLPWRRGLEPRPQFLAWLDQYTQILDRQHIPREDACIVGSAVLEMLGVRDATDIDCIVGDREPRFPASVVPLGDGVDLVSKGYHRRDDGEGIVSDRAIVASAQHHFRMRGLKVANPEFVLDRKRQHRRAKDLADLRLWEFRTAAAGTPSRPLSARAVVWCTDGLDVEALASMRAEAGTWAADGVELVVAGPPAVPSLSGIPAVPAPPPLDALPVELLADVDPRRTLAAFGIAPGPLMERAAAVWGPPAHPGHALRRLRGLAWTARWMQRWLVDLEVDLVCLRSADPYGLLLGEVAGHLGLRRGRGAEDAPAGRADRAFRRDAAMVCREALEPLAMFARINASTDAVRASELAARVGALEREVGSREARIALLEAAVRSRTVATWIWGAGQGGADAVRWLRARGASLCGVIDSDPGKHGGDIEGLAVHAPRILADSLATGTAFQVVVASVHAAAIVEHLRAMGVAPDQVTVAGDSL